MNQYFGKSPDAVTRREGGNRLNTHNEIEMSFIRTLAARGVMLSAELSIEDRRERIRVAILRERLERARFSEELTFAQAFEQCYARRLEMRRVTRDGWQRPTDIVMPADD